MTTKTAWAALITRLPAADDLPLTTLLELIETSQADVEARTGTEIAHDLTPGEQARCHAAAALSQVQPRLKNSAGHNACQAWVSHRVTAAGQVYQRHARDVLTEIAANPFIYLRNHPPSKPDTPDPANDEAAARGGPGSGRPQTASRGEHHREDPQNPHHRCRHGPFYNGDMKEHRDPEHLEPRKAPTGWFRDTRGQPT